MHRSAGQELVEYALILPILLALLLGIMELGLAVFNYNTMSNAAREAARAGIVTVPRDETTKLAIKDAGLRLTAGTPLTRANFKITWLYDNNNVAIKVQVIVTQTYHLLTGSFLTIFGLPKTIPMTATATMNLE